MRGSARDGDGWPPAPSPRPWYLQPPAAQTQLIDRCSHRHAQTVGPQGVGWPVDKASVDKASVDKASVDKASVDKASVDKASVDTRARPKAQGMDDDE
jgi:hypothetical protein